MNFAELTFRNKTFAVVAVVAMVVAGVHAYFTMGRLEDPEFTIKEALVVTSYPGATAQEVADEVTDEIESAVQRMGQLDRVTSVSEPGRSIVTVVIRDRYDSAALPQVWDELRRRVGDAALRLPPGAGNPVVRDDFGDVYGVFYAITGDGFSDAELEQYAKTLRRELLLVPGVGSIRLFGEQQEVVFVEFSPERIAQLGIAPSTLMGVLAGQNLAAAAGEATVGDRRIRLDPSGQLQSVEDIGNLLIPTGAPGGVRLYLRDIAQVTRGYADPPTTLMRFNGRPAIGLAISTVEGGNVVTMGEAVTAKMAALEAQIPVGVEIGLVAHQADTVSEAVGMFVASLVQAFAIVIGVLMLFTGFRSGLLIGVVLVLTVLGTFAIMKATGVMLERVSLGALVIALALMVDNAIVIVDGMQVAVRSGMKHEEAGARVVRQTAYPLLGATMVAVFAFAAIGLSQDSTGEYTRSLFLVMLYSLLLSWVLAVTITPLFGLWLLKAPKGPPPEPFTGVAYRFYGRILSACLRHRVAVLFVTVVLLVLSLGAFRYVNRNFFPPSTRPQFMVNLWAPRGTSIEAMRRDVVAVEAFLRAQEHVTEIASFVGAGSPRFLLTYTPENQSPDYALVLVEVDTHRAIGPIVEKVETELRAAHPDLTILARRFALGPGDLQKIHVRIRGPEPDTLQDLRAQVVAAFRADPDIVDITDDWRERTPLLRPIVNETEARDAGLTRREIAEAMRFATDGVRVGVYREGDTLLPIVARQPEAERQRVADVRDALVWSPVAGQRISMRQVVAGFEGDSEHTLLHRRDRLPTITVMADAESGDANSAVQRLRPALDALALPPGYTIEWGGEYESSRDAQAALAGNFPVVGLLMALTVILLYNALRPPLIVLIVVPLGLVGVSFGLLFTGQPFGFMSLLGFMSLAGMLIKNAIVLLDEIALRLKDSTDPMQAVRMAGVSRLSPVVLAAVTTVLGMIPLLPDDFFVAMAVTIMAGLSFATVLTLLVVPVLYSVLYRLPHEGEARGEARSATPAAASPAGSAG